MDLDRFLNLLSTLFGAMGSVYLLKGVLGLSPDVMARLASTHWGFSLPQVESLAAQKADSIAGVSLITVAFALAIVNIATVPQGLHVFQGRGLAVAVAAALAGLVFVAVTLIGNGIYRHEKLAVGRVLTNHYLDVLYKKRKIDGADAQSLAVHARDLLELRTDPSAEVQDLLRQVAATVGREVPQDLDFSPTGTK